MFASDAIRRFWPWSCFLNSTESSRSPSRRLDTSVMALVTDGMNRLFSNDVAPVRALRDFGLGVVDRLPVVKDALISRAAGIDRGGPRLLSGHPI